MSCSLFGSLSSDQLDRLLTAEEEMVLEDHLLVCRPCRERHADLHELQGLLAEMGDVEPATGLAARLETRLCDDVRSPWGSLTRALLALVPIRPLLPSTTSVALLLMVAATVWPQHLSTDRSRDYPAEHRASMLTVWDSDRERIVAAVLTEGFDGAVDTRFEVDAIPPMADDGHKDVEVRIFLYESIVVRG